MKRRILSLFLILLLVFPACTGKAPEETAETAAAFSDQTVLLKIGEEPLGLNPAMLFLSSQKHVFEEAYGRDLWEVPIDGEPFEAVLKDSLKSRVALLFGAYLMAGEYGIALTAEEEKTAGEAAAYFYQSIGEESRERLSITQEDVSEFFLEYLLALRAYETLIANEKIEISEDAARIVRVRQIRIGTEGLSDAQKKAKLLRANEALALAEQGTDFSELTARYNEAEKSELVVSRDDLSEEEEKAVFSLNTGEISPVVELPDAYVIFKCVSSYEEEASVARRTEMLDKQKDLAFVGYLETFLQTHPLRWNEEAWARIDLGSEESDLGTDLYAAYNKYFSFEN